LSQKPYSLHAKAKKNNTTITALVAEALQEAGNVSDAARLLDIDHSTLIYHMKRNGISLKRCHYVLIQGEVE
jgi:transcriptional regulator of acetoin/glycerol metabolism